MNTGGISSDKAMVNVEVSYAGFAGSERRKRGKSDKFVQIFLLLLMLIYPIRQTVEMAAAIKNTFEPVIMTQLYPRSLIDISILVLQQDGGVLSAAINATTLALIHAGVALSSPVCSITLSCLHNTPLLDPCAPEETDLPTLTIACLAPSQNDDEAGVDAGIGKVTLVNMETRLSIDRFEGMLKLGAKACAVISAEMDEVARAWTEDAAEKMAGGPAPVTIDADIMEED